MIALALVVSIVMGTLLTRSVLALSATVRRFAAKDFSARTRVHSRDEIGQLGESFNAMADIIQVHSDRLEDMVRQRTRELSEEKQTSERLLLNVLPDPIQIGIHTGPVVAGVIGTKKFIYDLWGDTVNTASRMESHGVPGRVQVSEATYQLLAGRFAFEPRPPIDVKGKGAMQTYLVIGRSGSAGVTGSAA